MTAYKLQRNISLKDCNTLKLDVSANYFFVIHTIAELRELLASRIIHENKVLVLGGGSNILFSENYQGIVLHMNIKGIVIVHEDENCVHLEIGAGEDWPSLVEYAVSKGWGGIENLALIPGTAGASPVQNIAAYGQSIHETLLSVETINFLDKSSKTFLVNECGLGYRTSVFKTVFSGQHAIVKIVLKLQKHPTLNIDYQSRHESLQKELAAIGSAPYTIEDVFQAVVNIRKRKLPDVDNVGTAGSIFKNPLITWEQLKRIKRACPDIHYYSENNRIAGCISNAKSTGDKMVRIPAAWLIDEMGWAGKRVGNCGAWPTQPLSLVNYGNATPTEYLSFITMVKDAVFEKYSIVLEPEVVVV